MVAMIRDICPSCQAWRVCPDDRHCGGCGRSLLLAEAEVEPAFVYADQQVGEVRLAIRNAGSGSLEGSEVEVSAADGEVAFKAVIPDGELRNNDGSSFPLTLPVRDLLGDGRPRTWELRHRGAPGSGEARLLRRIRVNLPPPVVELAESELVMRVAEPDHLSAVEQALTLRMSTKLGDGVEDLELRTLACEARGESAPRPVIHGLSLPLGISHRRDLTVPLRLSGELMRMLVNQPRGVGFDLVASFSGREAEERERPLRIPFRLRVQSPARPVLRLAAERFIGMNGSALRVGFEVENLGGDACQLDETLVQLSRGPDVLRTLRQRSPGRQTALAPGDPPRPLEVSLPLQTDDGSELGPGLYALLLKQTFAGLDGEQAREALVEVRAVRDYHGVVAIDFGTTATAVAVQQAAARPLLPRLGRGTDYLPTAILYYLEDGACRWVIGDDALDQLAEQDAGYPYFFDNLKLHLDSPQKQLLPDGTNRSWAGIAADYLTALRARLQADPAVAARIADVYPTHPAAFPPIATEALLRAYAEAGMRPRRHPVPDGGRVVMSESWPQVLLELPLPLLDRMRTLAFGPGHRPRTDEGRFGIVTIDVGGGTTDLSLFDVELRGIADATITELATDSDFDFCGNRFSALIAAGIIDAADRHMRAKGLQALARAAPYVLPWDDTAVGAVSPTQRDNGRAIAALALRLQRQDGPLQGLVGSIPGKIKSGEWAAVTPPSGDDADEAHWKSVRNAWSGFGDDIAAAWPFADEDPPVLRLRLQRGDSIDIPWGEDGIHLDLGDFLQAFAGRVVAPFERRMRGLFRRAEQADLDLSLVVTGRGSLFPPVTQVLYELAKRHYDLARVKTFLGVDSDFLKGIAAYGSAELASFTRGIPHQIRFQPKSVARLCVAAGFDLRTGRRQLIPIANGMPAIEDDWQYSAVPLHLRPGDELRVVELYLSPHFDVDDTEVPGQPGPALGLLDPERDRPLVTLTRDLTLSEADAARVHVAVRREPPDCLRVRLVWPGQSGASAPDDDWHGVDMGREPISDGGCDQTRAPTGDGGSAREPAAAASGDAVRRDGR